MATGGKEYLNRIGTPGRHSPIRMNQPTGWTDSQVVDGRSNLLH
jgi:hypothetical protein